MLRGFNTLRFETTPDGQPANAGLTPDGLQGEPPPDQGGEREWEGISQDEWLQAQQMLVQQNDMLERLAPVADYMSGAPGPASQDAPQLPDPFTSQNYASEMEAYLEHRDQQRLAPYQDIMQQQRLETLEASARDMIGDVISREGDLLMPDYEEGVSGLTPADRILAGAKEYSAQTVAQYGEGVRADEEAIRMAYEDEKTYQSALIAAHEAQQQNRLHALRTAPREPGSSGIAAQPAVTTQPGGKEAFMARWGLSG